jgi:hypothetical protein
MATKKQFSDIAPELLDAKYFQLNIPQEIVNLVVNLAHSHRSKTGDSNQKKVLKSLREQSGLEVVAPEVVKLAAALAILCEKLADGIQKKITRNYLQYRISIAAFHYGRYGCASTVRACSK